MSQANYPVERPGENHFAAIVAANVSLGDALTGAFLALRAVSEWASDEGPLAGKSPMAVSAWAKETLMNLSAATAGHAPRAIAKLVETVDATGGIELYEDGTYAPKADPDWIDLADVYLLACEELHINPLIDGERT